MLLVWHGLLIIHYYGLTTPRQAFSQHARCSLMKFLFVAEVYLYVHSARGQEANSEHARRCGPFVKKARAASTNDSFG